jgi:SAM-dependent methyltransferase
MSEVLKMKAMNEAYHYPGEELHLFESARNWKRYLAEKIKPWIRGSVLEVGAGIGETTAFLQTATTTQWTCLEPDAALFHQLEHKKKSGQLSPGCLLVNGSLPDLDQTARFDTILYIDVLEHIDKDRAELTAASQLLNRGGHLIVLSPACQFLYSSFDRAIGHCRRYNKAGLRAAGAIPGLSEKKIFFLESTGVLLLLLNKLIVHKKYPSRQDIRIWQSVFIPVSRVLDKLLLYRFGKTIIGVWVKD